MTPTGKSGAAGVNCRPTSGRFLWLCAVFAASALASGCQLRQWIDNGFKVGPNYARPLAPAASEWIDYKDPRVKSEEQDLSAWWQVFKDPALDNLVATAYDQNLSLRVAGARILAARAQRGIAAGNLFPQLQEAFGSWSRDKFSSKVANPAPDLWSQHWEGGFNASWELDFWGRFRRGIEAADAELDSSIENYDDVLVVLLSDIASNYVQYRTFEQRLVYARKNVVIQEKSYQLADDKFKAGASTERDMQQAKQVLEQTRALIPLLEIGQRQASNRLCVLLGIPPSTLAATLGKAGAIPTAPIDVAVGIPAELIRRRPDIRRAERQVAAQSARIGIAEADFYPRFALNGTIGLAAEQFWDLGRTPGSVFGTFAPSFRWDILNYGRILNNVRVQDARFEELAFDYQNRVLDAAREAEDAIIAFLRNQERAARLADSVLAASRTVEITYEQYRQGAVDFTPVFLFESTLTDQEDQLAAAQGDIALSLISVYRSLGGGWQMRLSRQPAPENPGPVVPGQNVGGAATVPHAEAQALPPIVVSSTDRSTPVVGTVVGTPRLPLRTDGTQTMPPSLLPAGGASR
ncbi:MAG: efflux transporter outer membrane subunit [Gemmataceae bacterium]|nr:efflux transporter outer membrane subunit [Gemmataceae bacterium]